MSWSTARLGALHGRMNPLLHKVGILRLGLCFIAFPILFYFIC